MLPSEVEGTSEAAAGDSRRAAAARIHQAASIHQPAVGDIAAARTEPATAGTVAATCAVLLAAG